MDIFYSNYASRYCLGLRLNEFDARKLWGALSIGAGLGNNPYYQVLANEETRRFEENYNLIISSCTKENLEPIKPIIENLLRMLEEEKKIIKNKLEL